ncbi:dolichyl-phosphate beta-glucosyltransferase [Rhodotorula paludigena]|uniref:dolichyl-phosphate beta-glucosyltransferase n=1 Tax=Rhodotorula paludigena TaxID=86838 RepID=UPI00317F4848
MGLVTPALLAAAAFVGVLALLAYVLLVLFSPHPPVPSPSESTYLTPSSPSTPLPLPLLSDPAHKNATLELTVVVPAYNERQRLAVMLRPAVQYLEERPMPPAGASTAAGARKVERGSYEILIVDDGSNEGTAEYALELAKELEGEFGSKRGQVKVCRLVRNRGKGGATKHGVLHASGQRILFVDADGATHFPDLALLEDELETLERAQAEREGGAHGLIVGSRAHLVATEAVVKRSALRNLLMRSFHLYLSLLGLSSIRDTQCGFKLHARATAQLLYPSLHSPGWIFDCELLLLAERCGVPLREVGVKWTEVAGSKLDVVTDSVRMARDLLVIRGNYLMGRWSTPARVSVGKGVEVRPQGIRVKESRKDR